MSAQTIDKISGLVAVNSLMAMAGGTLVGLMVGRNDPGFVHNGPLAGLVAICAGSDVMHPIGALATGGRRRRALRLHVHAHAEPPQDRRRAGRMAAARLVRRMGRHRVRHIRHERRSAESAASRFMSQLIGTAMGIAVALIGGVLVYGILKAVVGIRLDREQEFNGSDLSIHRITATPERESGW